MSLLSLCSPTLSLARTVALWRSACRTWPWQQCWGSVRMAVATPRFGAPAVTPVALTFTWSFTVDTGDAKPPVLSLACKDYWCLSQGSGLGEAGWVP